MITEVEYHDTLGHTVLPDEQVDGDGNVSEEVVGAESPEDLFGHTENGFGIC